MTAPSPIYRLTGIRHYYGAAKVLDINDLEIKTGSIIGLIGANGSGKSTLLKMLAFALKPTEGRIFYKGREASGFSPEVRSRVTLLTQKPYLLKRTVFENIIYGLKIRNDLDRLEERTARVMSDVGLDFKGFAHRKWNQLSGGEAQRVALAARLILRPEVLLLDEPIASVDTRSAQMIRKASIKARDDWGATLVIASHDLQWLYSISDHQFSIFNGNLFPTGVETIISGPFEKIDDHTVSKGLDDGQSLRLKAPAGDREHAIIKKRHIVLDPGKQLEPDRFTRLSGRIASMLLEKRTGRIMTTVLVQDLTFVLDLTREQISGLELFPGKDVSIGFCPENAEWF